MTSRLRTWIIFLAMLAGLEAKAQSDTWIPIGINEKRIATGWVQLSSYESLNIDSFRLNAKFTNQTGTQIVGRIDVNCKNKDFYFRPNGVFAQQGAWAAIPSGSGVERIGELFCKRTGARSEWGFAEETKRLWDQPSPVSNASDASGEWSLAFETDESENYYNTGVKDKGDHLMVATWSRAKKGDRSAAQPSDTQGYGWINVDCKSNHYSGFLQPDRSVEGTWLAPVPGRPGGIAMQVKKKYCKATVK